MRLTWIVGGRLPEQHRLQGDYKMDAGPAPVRARARRDGGAGISSLPEIYLSVRSLGHL